MNKINDVFVKIQNVRYKLSAIKRYEPFETVSTEIKNDSRKTVEKTCGGKYGIYIYFSTNGASQRVYHYYLAQKERDKQIEKLDQLFNVTFLNYEINIYNRTKNWGHILSRNENTW